jgi:hypothetical protein
MGMYGDTVLLKYAKPSVVTYEDFIEAYYDCVYSTESMFDKINSSILNEGDYDLVDTGRVTYDDTKQKDSDNESKKEETKKNIFEKLKELFIKAVKFVTSIFQKFVDWVHNIYMNSNIKDSIGQAIGKHIEYKNLATAYEKGWQGLPETIPMVNPMTIEMSSIYDAFREKLEEYKVQDIIDKIGSTNDLSEAQEKFDEFKNYMDKMHFTNKSIVYSVHYVSGKVNDHNFSAEMSQKITSVFGSASDEKIAPAEELYLVYSLKPVGGKKGYMPDEIGFTKTKSFAEHGEEFTKKYKVQLEKVKKDCKEYTVDFYEDRVLNKDPKMDVSEDGKKMQILFDKSNLMLSQTKIKVFAQSISETIKILKFQQNMSIKFLIECYFGTKKYLKSA